MTPAQVVACSPLGRTAVYAGIKAGEIPSLTINGRLFVPTGELRRRWRVDAAAPPAAEESPPPLQVVPTVGAVA